MASKNNGGRRGRHDLTIVYLFDAPRALVFRNWIDAAGLSTWFAGGKTEMTFKQTGFRTAKKRDDHVEGWNECFRQLDIRTLIERWANAVQHQDIETILWMIAHEHHSYPLGPA